MAVKKKITRKKNMNLEMSFLNVSSIKKKYKEYGIEYGAQKVYLIYVIAMLFAALISYLYRLNVLYTAIILVSAFFATPIVIIANVRKKHEENRFMDANSYMKQLIEGIADYRMITPVLTNMSSLFEEGDMKRTLIEASNIIKTSRNVKLSKKEALMHVEEKYACEHMKIIHDFCIRIEENGGDFIAELNMLDDFRDAWMNQITKYHKDLEYTMKMANVIYVILLFACVYVLHTIEPIKEINITYHPVVQLANFLFIMSFIVFILYTQNKVCEPLLKENEHMTAEEVKVRQDYIENFKESKSRKVSTQYGIISLVVMTIAAIAMKSIAFAIVGVIVSALFFNMHFLVLADAKKQVKEEIISSFPKWLFDLCLYMQKDNVVISIENSLLTSPPIMRDEIQKLLGKLKENPTSSEAFLEFMGEYKLNEVKDTMKMLLSIKLGNIKRKTHQMQKLVNYNMEMITKTNEIKMKKKKSMHVFYYMFPIIPMILVALVYCACIVLNSFSYVMELIQSF